MIYYSLRDVAREAFGSNIIGYEGSRGSRCGIVYLHEEPEEYHIETSSHHLYLMKLSDKIYNVSFIKKK